MRNMSFALTTEQVEQELKDVTRRIGWDFLKAGDRLCAIERAQGLKKGEKVRRLKTLDVVEVRQEPLRRMLDDPAYGAIEVVREGFPDLTPAQFVEFFCQSHRAIDFIETFTGKARYRACTPDDKVTRIEFTYVGGTRPTFPLIAGVVAEDADRAWQDGIASRIRLPVQVLNRETAERAAVVLCAFEHEIRGPRPDDIIAPCASCRQSIRYRAHAPKIPPKMCIRCGERVLGVPVQVARV